MRLPFLSASLLLAAGCADPAAQGRAAARGALVAVGSSTVYPFTALVAERFAALHPDGPTPVIEATGTGAGIRLFCAGRGARHPDLTDASRRMTAAEHRDCAAHGVRDVLELPIGLDGVVLAQAPGGRIAALSTAQLYRALAAAPDGAPNRARRWRDVDAALPDGPIRVFGPPATSGTRDSLVALLLARGCRAARAANCARIAIRADGAYADAGESDNLTVEKVAVDPLAIGIFGYGYLAANRARLRGVAIDGVAPSRGTIGSGRYPGARRLYLYVKRDALATVPALRALLALYRASLAPDGVLVRHGLIPVSGPAPLDPAGPGA